MKFVSPKVEIIPQEEGLLGVYKQIELAGRTCYKSEDKITEDSCKEFVQRMINNGHTAMLEHGTVYLKSMMDFTKYSDPLDKYIFNKYSHAVYNDGYIYVTTNLRVLQENGWMEDLQYLCSPTENHEKRITARFTCDRGVSHELVRHRVFSFAQESTRFCNYSKDKFGSELTFITPSGIEKYTPFNEHGGINNYLRFCEDLYLGLLDQGWKPQDARAILPNCLKTEVVMTGFESDWKHFFDLRCALSAHPDMQVLAKELQRLMSS